jgi:hypothetical protein
MALGADFNPDLFLGGTGEEGVPAGAGHPAFHVFRMDTFFHRNNLLNSPIIIPDFPAASKSGEIGGHVLIFLN